MTNKKMLAFGPVPSRRLGQSLGINNIPPKICTYSCIYCQVGKTLKMQFERQAFYEPNEIFQEVEAKVQEALKRNEAIDFLTFVPDGEPTLDINLGHEIELVRELGFKIAVISNASLIWREDVRKDLQKADWVSLKIDALDQDLWRRINRAHGYLNFDEILRGIQDFSRSFNGELATETMLVQDYNDHAEELERIADFIAGLKPAKSYLAIPTRPPALHWVKAAREPAIAMAYQLFHDRSIDVEYLIGYEGDAFAFTGNVEEDLLSITSVHPMREQAVQELLVKADADWGVIHDLIEADELIEVVYEDHKYYLRKLPTLKKMEPNH